MKNCFIFEQIQPFVGQYACVMLGKKWGVINKSGDWIIKPKYEKLKSYKENLFFAQYNGKYGIIDEYENTIIGFEYDLLENTLYNKSQNFIICKNNSKYGIIDTANKVVIPLEYDYIYTLNTTLFTVIKNGKTGCININNDTIIPFEYDKIILYSDYIIVGKYQCVINDEQVENKLLYGIVDYNNNILVPFEYIELLPFDEDLSLSDKPTFSAKIQDNKFIIIDIQNKQMTDQEFDDISPFGEKLFSAGLNNKYCAIDRFGEIEIEYGKFCRIYNFHSIDNGLIGLVEDENFQEAFIDECGNIIISYNTGYKTDGYFYTRGNSILVNKNKKFGVIDINNNVLIPFLYDWIYYEQDNFNGAEINNKWGYIDNSGNPLIIKPVNDKTKMDNGQLNLLKG